MLDVTSGTILLTQQLSLVEWSQIVFCCPLGLDEPTHQVFVGVTDCECGPTSHAAGVLVFDARNGTLLKRIALREGSGSVFAPPSGIVVDQRTRRVFVALDGYVPKGLAGCGPRYAVSLLDADTDRVLQNVDEDCSGRVGLLLDSRAQRVVVLKNEGDGTRAEVLHSKDGHLIRSLTTKNFLPSSASVDFVAAVDERTGYIWLVPTDTYPNGSSATIVVLDPRRGKVVRRVPLRGTPWGAAVAQRARRVFIINRDAGTVTVLCADRKC
jgi:DNA-binding beta-propeller fold protein YncE